MISRYRRVLVNHKVHRRALRELLLLRKPPIVPQEFIYYCDPSYEVMERRLQDATTLENHTLHLIVSLHIWAFWLLESPLICIVPPVSFCLCLLFLCLFGVGLDSRVRFTYLLMDAGRALYSTLFLLCAVKNNDMRCCWEQSSSTPLYIVSVSFPAICWP